ncbi:MAG: hypothetical protein KDK53_18500 [Maritimibacter sp.]|nr:hypothetical protein [Maritimibacter sp.]
MFDLTPRADSLHVFANEYADALQNAAMLLGGAKWFQRAARFCDTLSDGGSISRRLLAEGASLRDLLALRFLDDPFSDEAAMFAALDPADPAIEEICVVTDALDDALRASREEVGTDPFAVEGGDRDE